MTKKRLHKLILLFLSTSYGASAYAAEDILDLTLTELLNLKVSTASKKQEGILETPAPIRILTRQDIDRLGFATLEQTMNYFTGVSSVNGEGNVFTTYTIRGNTLVNFNTNTLLLLDGVPLYSPYHNSFDLSVIPLVAIERIEMIPGAQSVLYGSNAINAVINIITVNNRTEEVDSLNGNQQFRIGSFKDRRFASNNRFKTDKGTITVALDIYSRQGETQNLIDEALITTTLDDQLDQSALLVNWQSEQWQFQLNSARRELPNYRTRGFSTLQENKETSWQVATKYFDTNQWGDFNFKFTYYDWQLIKTFIPVNNDPVYDWDYSGSLVDLQFEQSINISSTHTGSLGVNFAQGKARRFKEDIGAFDIGLFDEPTDSFAIFWNAEYKVNDKDNLVYGARYYESRFEDIANNREVTLTDVSPRFGWIRKTSENASIKLLYSEAFRVPTYFEKQVSSSRVLGNANLKPETSQSFDFVYTHLFPNWQLEINPFIMQIDDKITRVDLVLPPSDPDFGKRQNQNIGTVNYSGIETNARFAYEKSISGLLGIGLYKGKNKTTDEDIDLTYSSMINGQISFQLNDSWTLDTSAKILSDWGKADSYTQFNVTANYKLESLESSRIFFRVENLFEEDIRLPEIGRENAQVPTIPEMSDIHFYLGWSVNY